MAFLLGVLFIIAAANGGSSFPYVIDYSGPSKAYCVERAGKCLMPAPLFPLQAGDRVSIVGSAAEQKGTTIALWVDGARYVVGANNSPFCVGRIEGRCGGPASPAAGASVSSVQEKLLKSVSELLRDANGDAHAPASVARGISVPPGAAYDMAPPGYQYAPDLAMLHASPRARTVAVPDLRFAWRNGMPPFEVTLKHGPTTVAQRSNVMPNDLHFGRLDLAVGTYELTVREQTGSHRADSQSFDVIASRNLPRQAARDAAALQTLPTQIAAVARAAWLAKQGPPWYLAAYETLNAVPNDFPPAAQLRFYLTEGP